MANVTDSLNFYVSRPSNISGMLVHRQAAGKCNTKIFLPGRKREYQYFQYEWMLEVDLEVGILIQEMSIGQAV